MLDSIEKVKGNADSIHKARVIIILDEDHYDPLLQANIKKFMQGLPKETMMFITLKRTPKSLNPNPLSSSGVIVDWV